MIKIDLTFHELLICMAVWVASGVATGVVAGILKGLWEIAKSEYDIRLKVRTARREAKQAIQDAKVARLYARLTGRKLDTFQDLPR